MSFVDRHINPDRLKSESVRFYREIVQDYEAEIERCADGGIIVHEIEPGFHESIEDMIHDNAADVFADCPEEPGRYRCEASCTFRYSGRHTAGVAVRFQKLAEVAL